MDKKATTPAGVLIREFARTVETLRADMLFGGLGDNNNNDDALSVIETVRVSSANYMIAVSLLEQAIQHLRLAEAAVEGN